MYQGGPYGNQQQGQYQGQQQNYQGGNPNATPPSAYGHPSQGGGRNVPPQQQQQYAAPPPQQQPSYGSQPQSHLGPLPSQQSQGGASRFPPQPYGAVHQPTQGPSMQQPSNAYQSYANAPAYQQVPRSREGGTYAQNGGYGRPQSTQGPAAAAAAGPPQQGGYYTQPPPPQQYQPAPSSYPSGPPPGQQMPYHQQQSVAHQSFPPPPAQQQHYASGPPAPPAGRGMYPPYEQQQMPPMRDDRYGPVDPRIGAGQQQQQQQMQHSRHQQGGTGGGGGGAYTRVQQQQQKGGRKQQQQGSSRADYNQQHQAARSGATTTAAGKNTTAGGGKKGPTQGQAQHPSGKKGNTKAFTAAAAAAADGKNVPHQKVFPDEHIIPSELYSVHVPTFQLCSTPNLEFLELLRRYERLFIPSDFTSARRLHFQGQPLPLSISKWNSPLPIHHEFSNQKIESGVLSTYDPNAFSSVGLSTESGVVVYNAKVVLLSGLSEAERTIALIGPAGNGGDHISRLLKFIVAKAERSGKKSGISALGGRCDPAIDGNPNSSNTEQANAALIKAAIRHVGIQTGIDLSACTSWHRIVDISYFRAHNGTSNSPLKDCTETTVMFLVDDAQKAVPCSTGTENWAEVWANRHANVFEKRSALLQGGVDAAAAVEKLGSFVEGGGGGAEGGFEAKGGNGGDDNAVVAPVNADSVEAAAAPQQPEDDGVEDGELPIVTDASMAAAAVDSKPAPPTPCLPSVGLHNAALKLKTMSISLDGLLDYNDRDIEEATFELSVFAETLHEILSRDAGEKIVEALKEKAWAIKVRTKNRRRGRGKSGHRDQEQQQPEVKKRKIDGDGGGGEGGKGGGNDVEGQAAAVAVEEIKAEEQESGGGEVDGAAAAGNIVDPKEEGGGAAVPEKVENEPVKDEPAVDAHSPAIADDQNNEQQQQLQQQRRLEDVMLAFSYFDTSGCGYVKVDDLLVILESLGLGLHHTRIKNQVVAAAGSTKAPAKIEAKYSFNYRVLCGF